MITYDTDTDYLIITASHRREAGDLELLFLSRSIPFTVEPLYRGKRFYIPQAMSETARDEIDAFLAENRRWPPVAVKEGSIPFSFSLVHLGVVFLLYVFYGQVNSWRSQWPWLESGALSVEKVLAGEWGRTVTALTLHLDGGHLLSNFLGLLLFVGGVHQFVGAGLAWLLVLIAGAVGNFLTAVFYQSGHDAIGASTAVFGAVGIMGGMGAVRYWRRKVMGRRFFIPLVGCLGLFAMLGANPKTDVMAHLFGLISGMAVSLAFLPLLQRPLLESRLVQVLALIASGGIIVSAWRIQLGL